MTKIQLFLAKFFKKYKIMKVAFEQNQIEMKIKEVETDNLIFIKDFERVLKATPEELSLCDAKFSVQINQILLKKAVDNRNKFIYDNIERYAKLKI